MTSIRSALVPALVLALITIGVYWQTFDHGFVNYDDHRYITRNARVLQGLTFDNFLWALTSLEVANWHPLTWLSHMADVSLFGAQNAGAHHIINVLLHAANAVILMLLLQRMTGSLWRSALAAALFSLHPLRVESVAWVSERKDVLSVFFGLLAIWMYVTHVRSGGPRAYINMLVLYACSLMSKPMLVTLPAVLLLLDYWPLNRLGSAQVTASSARAEEANGRRFTQLVIEKLPLLAMSIASAVITMIAQSGGGAVGGLAQMPPGARLANALVSYAIYLRQMIWPVNLAPLYPRVERWDALSIIIAAAALVLITVVVVARSRQRRELLVGWLWYLGTLVPVIGLIQIGSHAHADRYTYFPSIGVMIMIAWSLPAGAHRRIAPILAAAAALVLLTLCVLTWRQTQHWRDSITLSTHTLRVTHDNAIAHFNLANALNERGETDPAIEHFQQASQIMPRWPDVPFNLGNTYLRLREFDRAIEAYDLALLLKPDFTAAHVNRGIALAQRGDIETALASFEAALQVDPNDPDAHMNLAQTLVRIDRIDEAITHYQHSIAMRWDNPTAHLLLGNALAMSDRLTEAITHFGISLQMNPNQPRAHMSMASALASRGSIDRALQHLNTAAELARHTGDTELQQEIEHRAQRIQQMSMPSPPPAVHE